MRSDKSNDINISKKIATWPKNHPCFWLQMRVGALSHILPTFESARNGDVQNFFWRHYGDKADPLVFDGSSEGYFFQLSSLVHIRQSLANVLDLGSGNGALYPFLKKENLGVLKYTGLDFAVKTKALSDKASILQIDLTNPESLKISDSHNTLFAINTFCYVENLTNIPLLNDAKSKSNNTLFVLEPWPGLFWDRHFEGIWPKYRLPYELIATLSKIGWTPIQQVNYYFSYILGKYFWPLSYALSFQKDLN